MLRGNLLGWYILAHSKRVGALTLTPSWNSCIGSGILKLMAQLTNSCHISTKCLSRFGCDVDWAKVCKIWQHIAIHCSIRKILQSHLINVFFCWLNAAILREGDLAYLYNLQRGLLRALLPWPLHWKEGDLVTSRHPDCPVTFSKTRSYLLEL